jgi:hypothetical protein
MITVNLHRLRNSNQTYCNVELVERLRDHSDGIEQHRSKGGRIFCVTRSQRPTCRTCWKALMRETS